MEEIKDGEYVRTKLGTIAKIINVEFDIGTRMFTGEVIYKNWKEDFGGTYVEYEEIVKHSTNIADLIEVGDWAIMNCYGLIVKKVITQDDIWELKTGNYQLLKILTKERFESESYEV